MSESGWRPIDMLEEADDGDVLFWNPCDGVHMLWMLHHGPADRIRRDYPEFTHWMPAPAGPGGR